MTSGSKHPGRFGNPFTKKTSQELRNHFGTRAASAQNRDCLFRHVNVRMTWSCPVCCKVNHDNRRTCSTRDCGYPGGSASASQSSGKDTRNSRRPQSSPAGRRWTCRACLCENYAWRACCHSRNEAAESACRGGSGGGFSRRPAQRATFSEFLSALCDRLRGGGESLGPDAMLVEEGASAKPRSRSARHASNDTKRERRSPAVQLNAVSAC